MNIESVAIVIPAYNESYNLKTLIPLILKILPKATIIIVDDSSGDQQKRTKNLFFRKSIIYKARGGKGGRGSAVIHGIKIALAHTPSKIIVEMDADFAHNPREIPHLCALVGPYDMVVGSRYMQGSNIISWTMPRLIQSKIINFFLRFWLGLNLTDYTNGFRAYSRVACQYLIATPSYEKGFIALSETAYKLLHKGFHMTEVPVSFTDRTFGKSNANLKELLQSLYGVILMRFRSY